MGRIGSERAVDPLIQCLNDSANNVRKSASVALGRIGLDKPIPELASVIKNIINAIDSMPQEKATSLICQLLQAAFRSADLDTVHESINVVMGRVENAESFCTPFVVALEYLQSDRDPAIIERQHPEMREAVQLLVGAFEGEGV